jgi:hypothetical protein
VRSTGIPRHRTKMFHAKHFGTGARWRTGTRRGAETASFYEKRYPDAEFEKHNHIGVAWSRRSKEAFVQHMASVPAASLGPLIPG